MDVNEITEQIIGAAIAVHRELGPGLLGSTYETCLSVELSRRGFSVDRQHLLPVYYQGVRVEGAYRVDMIVESRVLVELKSVAQLEPIHTSQMLTYLKLSGRNVGLLINFNVRYLKNGICRLVHGYREDTPSA